MEPFSRLMSLMEPEEEPTAAMAPEGETARDVTPDSEGSTASDEGAKMGVFHMGIGIRGSQRHNVESREAVRSVRPCGGKAPAVEDSVCEERTFMTFS